MIQNAFCTIIWASQGIIIQRLRISGYNLNPCASIISNHVNSDNRILAFIAFNWNVDFIHSFSSFQNIQKMSKVDKVTTKDVIHR